MANEDVFEFMGPWLGPVGIVAGLPCVCYLLVIFCGSEGCVELLPLKVPPLKLEVADVYSNAGLAVFLGWLAYVGPVASSYPWPRC